MATKTVVHAITICTTATLKHNIYVRLKGPNRYRNRNSIKSFFPQMLFLQMDGESLL